MTPVRSAVEGILKLGRLAEAPRNLSEVVEGLHNVFATILSQFCETVQDRPKH
jgi:hypothetical protein